MTPRAYLVHQIQGRLRLRIPDRREDEAFFEEVSASLDGWPDGVEIRVKPDTGSVLLLHPSVPFDELEPRLRDNGLFEFVAAPPPPGPALAPLLSGVSRLDRAVSEATAGSADLRTVLFIAAVGLAIRQLLRGELFGPALPLAWMAFEVASRLAESAKNMSAAESSEVGEEPDASS